MWAEARDWLQSEPFMHMVARLPRDGSFTTVLSLDLPRVTDSGWPASSALPPEGATVNLSLD